MSYVPKVYRHANGDQITVASGGTLNIDGTWKIGGTAITATASDINGAAGSATDFDIGASGTAGSLDIFPATAANGKLIHTATNNGGARNLTLTNVAQTSGSGTLKYPDMAGGTGQIVATNSDFAVTVNANGAGRTVSLAGNVTFAGAVTAAGALDLGDHALTLNTSGATEVTLPTTGTLCANTGTPGATFTVDSDNATGKLVLTNTTGGTNHSTILQTTAPAGADITITLPGTSGTLALSTGAETGTTSSTFTVDDDSGVGKFTLRTNSVAGTNHTVTLQAPTTTQAVTLTLPDAASDTVCAIAATQTLAAKTLTAPVINGATTAAAANNFDLSTGTGTFKTPTGIFTHYGNVASNGNITFDLSGSTGTFTTSSGTNTLSGNVVISGSKTLITGTGAATLKGSATFDTTKTLTFGSAAAGTAAPLTMYSLTANKGAFNITVADNATDHAVTLTNGAANGGAATITTPNATCTLSGLGLAESFSGIKTFTAVPVVAINDASNTAVTDVLTISHTTSGAPGAGIGTGISVIIENDTDATTQNASIDWVETGDGTKATLDTDVIFSTMLNGAVQPALTIDASDQSLTIGQNVTDADGLNSLRIYPVTTAKGSLIISSTANTDDNAITVTNAANVTSAKTVTIPAATCTLVGKDTTDVLTNKSIDGDNNTLTDIGPKVLKAAVKGTRGNTDAVVGGVFALTFDMDNTAGTSTWINDLDPERSVKVLNAWGVKTDSIGGASDTVAVGGSGGVITDVMSLTVGDGTYFNFITFDDSKTTIAHDATITVTTVKGTDHCECEIHVLCMWV